MERQQRQ